MAHEPPAARELPDREPVLAACGSIKETYLREGFGPAMAKPGRDRCRPDGWEITRPNSADATGYPRANVIGRAACSARAARSRGSLVSTIGLGQVLANAATTASVAVIVAGRPVAARSRAASRA